MKIIGHMSSTVTVQMSELELSAITGHQCTRGEMMLRGRSQWMPYQHVGEIAVREGWERLHLLNENKPELQKAIRQLRAIADVLEPLELVVSQEIEPETKQE